MNLFVERIDQNEEIFVRLMNDAPFREVVTAWMASEAYRRLRSGQVPDGGEHAERRLPPQLRLVEPDPSERYVTCVPLVPLQAAAGAFSDPQHIDDDDYRWVTVDTGRRLRPGMFIAQVTGRSMEPTIPDGAYCLFAAPVGGTRQGKTVLVQMRDGIDPESGERYTVKRYESEKVEDEGSWRHSSITLKPTNPEFEPIMLTVSEDRDLHVIAEVVEVLGA